MNDNLVILLNIIGLYFNLEHFEADEDTREAWQYDGGVDGLVVCVNEYISSRHVKSARVIVSAPGDEWCVWAEPLADVHDARSIEQLKRCLHEAKETGNINDDTMMSY